MIWAGQDPREIERRDGMTLRTAAAEFHRAHAASWSKGHAARWWSQLDFHILKTLGDRRLVDISTSDLVQVLGPIWANKHDTARRLLQRLVAVYESAIAGGTYAGSSPTIGVRRALPCVRVETEHFGAMDWRDLPAFHAQLIERDAVTARALRFIILTACRSGEMRGATWGELDLEAALWTVPAARMK